MINYSITILFICLHKKKIDKIIYLYGACVMVMNKNAMVKKYRVTPHSNIKEYLSLPKFDIQISKNDYDVWECHIHDFNLYVHSADPDYDSAFNKIRDRVKGLVITHIIEALDNNKTKAIYGENSNNAQNDMIDKLKKSYSILINDKIKIDNFIHELSIVPWNFSEKELSQFLKNLQSELEKLKENIQVKTSDLKKILLEALSNFSVYNFKPIHNPNALSKA